MSDSLVLEPSLAQIPAPRTEKVRIFLTEDEAVIALDLQAQLERAGYVVVGTAASAETAFEGIAATKPDLVLMDVVLKGSMDGITAAQRVREEHAIPVLFLTAYADEATLARAREAGAYGYLVKPFRMQELRAAIEVALYKRDMERALRQSEARFHGAFDYAAIGMALLDPRGRVMQVNPALESLLDRKSELLLGLDFDVLTEPTLEQERGQLLRGECRSVQVERRFSRSAGEPIWILVSLASVLDEQGRVVNVIAQLQDVSARKRAEEELTRMALHDALTGLINRTHLQARLDHALAQARRHQSGLAILFIDLDGFKRVNDTLGHDAGDELLKEIARRVKAAVREGDSVARWGGDEIVILVSDVDGEDATAKVAAKIVEVVGRPVGFRGQPMQVGASIGIALYPGGGTSSVELLIAADRAMYEAKNSGGNRYCFSRPIG